MACEKCTTLERESTTHFSVFMQVFDTIKATSTSMTETGKATCRYCHQKIEYDYDETLIPKLRITFFKV